MRKHSLTSILVALAAAAFLPLRSDGAPTTSANCCNSTTSLASTINNPVTGDEAFFKIPSGPTNIMFLLDTSGSMVNLPQCGDNAWNQGSLPTCTAPAAPFNTLVAPTASTYT